LIILCQEEIKLKHNFVKSMAIVLVVLCAGMLFRGLLPAYAGLDELIRRDVPYFNLSPVGGGEARGNGFASYVVQQGDTMTVIAGKVGVQLSVLATVNKLTDWDMVEAGRMLVVPGSVLKHRVRPGETLSGIACDYGVSLTGLMLVNNLADENLLITGQEMIVPLVASSTLSAWNPVVSLPVDELAWPVVGWISSGFGMREDRPHEGLDIAAGEGDPIRAVRSGRVTFAGPRGTYGLTVVIDHGGGLTTLYGHASALLVKEGDWVREEQLIARVGDTGRSTGPHLHLEIRLNNIPYDPLLCLKRMYA